MDGYGCTNYCYTIAIIEFGPVNMLNSKALGVCEARDSSAVGQRRSKAPKGTVSIGTSNGWLRLYWTYQGKRDHSAIINSRIVRMYYPWLLVSTHRA